MREELSLGTVPIEEDCEQLGDGYSPTRAKSECRAFINQLIREHGNPPGGARFKITSNPHDFGTYYDVVISFDPNNAKEEKYAYKVEGDLPFTWDDAAMKEIHGDCFMTVLKDSDVDLDGMRTALVSNGYVHEDRVAAPGQFSIRGGIVDIFSFGRSNPIRIELFGDTVESVRHFDENTQEILTDTDSIEINLRAGQKIKSHGMV